MIAAIVGFVIVYFFIPKDETVEISPNLNLIVKRSCSLSKENIFSLVCPDFEMTVERATDTYSLKDYVKLPNKENHRYHFYSIRLNDKHEKMIIIDTKSNIHFKIEFVGKGYPRLYLIGKYEG